MTLNYLTRRHTNGTVNRFPDQSLDPTPGSLPPRENGVRVQSYHAGCFRDLQVLARDRRVFVLRTE